MVLPLIPQEINFQGKSLTDLILALIILVYLINLIFSKKGRGNFINGIKDFFTDKLSIFMVILFAMMLVSTSYATDKALALGESARFITYIIMYFIVKYELNIKEEINVLLKCFIFTSFILSCFGIVQYFTGFALTEIFQKSSEAGGSTRIAATLSNPNAYGAYLILIIFPVIMLSIYEKNKKKKMSYILFSILIIVNILMTNSRNALLGFAIGLGVLTLIYSIKLIFALGGFGVLICFIPSVFQRLKGATSLSSEDPRVKLWKTALMMIKDHPLLGVGNGNFVTLYNGYVKKHKELHYYYYKDYPTHNSYLKVQSELGVIGIVSFLGIVITSLFRIKKLYTTTTDKFHKAFYTGVMASVTAFLFMNISDNLFFVPKTTTYFWLLLATAEALLYNHKESLVKEMK